MQTYGIAFAANGACLHSQQLLLPRHDGIFAQSINSGVDKNARGGPYGCALQASCLRGNASVARTLLKNGANFNLTGRHYHSSLPAAAFSGRTEIVQMLLGLGADVTLTGGHLLPAAALWGWTNIGAMLKDAGAKADGSLPRLLGGNLDTCTLNED